MSGGFSIGWDVCAGIDYGAVTATTLPTQLTASGTINTKGSWTQIGAAATYDISLIHLSLTELTSANQSALIDIGIGAGGSQQVLISNIPLRITSVNPTYDIILPLDIPSGTAIWARVQSSTASGSAHSIKFNGYSGGFTHPAGHSGGEGVGVATATSLPTLLTANAAGNTKGSYAQLIASTAHDYSGFIFYADAVSGTTYLVDLAIGGAGSEIPIMPNIYLGSAAGAMFYAPIAIPAGTRVAARCQCAAAAADTAYCAIVGMFR
jgi:hypothetical protein